MSDPNLGKEERPSLDRLTRRDLLRFGLIAAGAAAGGAAMLRRPHAISPPAVAPAKAGFRTLTLTARLSQNPAFLTEALPAGGMVAWVKRADDSVLAYRLNAPGTALYRLCDGRTGSDDVCRKFVEHTGRRKEEARAFLADLKRKGLVVEGGYVVASAGFPEAPGPRRYLHRLSQSDPKTEG